MSKERAVRRAAREAHTAAASAQAARRRARQTRRSRLISRLTPSGASLRRRPPRGLLAAKRQRTLGLMALGFVVVQALTWAAEPDWSTRAAVLVASVFALPVVAVFLF